ncbi:tRNA pseudouridine synthase A [Spizellomyces punctatus DAOM BR117]|uniref:tRNA pseudouridine synthase A n=1 Tax=Spizellomyces punctatus (strain DAOM BR117) TaxID=645134 RepID=A0A0L0HMP0_SPIPD|nr:tRNA pseudouridine synthase A [Spizellomyces punctatus DAOM BR117]KND02180.1 tRNA pseudouridine synthase A [Spizellomyces punctatus DAOM BR117]|eukprot:XP_016610219.1 tRNA pseudouridine synthase A [Spizellomyces punctatus DAOM BR117]
MSLEASESETTEVRTLKRPKRKVAILFGYDGKDFAGLQQQPKSQSVTTIEDLLLGALVEVGAISVDNGTNVEKNSWTRSGRTDRGVSAARQLISCKIMLEDPRAMVQKLNAVLPSDIRVWDIIPTPKNFNARRTCDSRKYEYALPTYVFRDPPPAAYYGPNSEAPPLPVSDEDITMIQLPISQPTLEDIDCDRRFRATAEQIATFRAIMTSFQGVHNFHNFTLGRSFKDKASVRRMIQIQVLDPEVHDGVEWLRVRLHGQSFMLHQIRKMIGLASLMVRTQTPISIIPETLTSVKLNIPKAPGTGLLMDEPLFQSYNTADKRRIESGKDPIDFSLAAEDIEKFKQHILAGIRQDEMVNHRFGRWARFIDSYSFTFATYLNRDGIVRPCYILGLPLRDSSVDIKDVVDVGNGDDGQQCDEQDQND